MPFQVRRRRETAPPLRLEKTADGKLWLEVPGKLLAVTPADLETMTTANDIDILPKKYPKYKIRGVWQNIASAAHVSVSVDDFHIRESLNCAAFAQYCDNHPPEDPEQVAAARNTSSHRPDLISTRGLLELLRGKVYGYVKGRKHADATTFAMTYGLLLDEIVLLCLDREELGQCPFVRGKSYNENIDTHELRMMIFEGWLKNDAKEGTASPDRPIV
eukprot:g12278.t1